ncbi:phage tail-collar fiber domain-containing protein, partial [Pasteurella multocida]|uniref:phage tail-collar fiber domain-containing protein n=1 Tax=Pasteurella multocida TaxID=747 RepID=UPI002AFE1FCC
MATLVTQDFEREIAEKTVNGGVIQYDEFIFAMIPGLNAENLAQHLTIPSESLIKHRQAVSKAGVINENSVVYSVTLGTEIGDFDFNWIGLINKRTNKLAAAVQADTIKKTRNKNNVQGNSLTRNVLLEFTGAKQLTGINVSADTWQIDFTVRLHGIDEKIRLTNRDLYGRAVFFDDAFLVKRGPGNNYTIDAGHAYVEGVRAEIKQAQTIQAASLPCSIYVDVVHHCTVTGAYETEIKFLKQSKSDYLDTAKKQHYVQIIADIDSTGAVTDRRLLSPWFGITPKDLDDTTESTRDRTGHTHKLPLASLIKKGLVQLYSGNDSDSEEMAATPKAVKTLKGFIDSLTRSLNNYIPNSKKSNADNSSSSDTIATSYAVKKVRDIVENRFSSLANADGYKHVGRCKSVEMLRKVVPSKHGQRILVDAYYEGGTTGGGEFVADLQDLTTADDGGSCFVVLNNTARWKRIFDDRVDVVDFGAKSDEDATIAFENAFKYAGEHKKIITSEASTYFINKPLFLSGVGGIELNGKLYAKMTPENKSKPIITWAENAITLTQSHNNFINLVMWLEPTEDAPAICLAGLKSTNLKIGETGCVQIYATTEQNEQQVDFKGVEVS